MAFLSDMRGSIGSRYLFGTDVNTLPLMEGINTGEDIKDVIWAGGASGSEPYGVRQWNAPFGARLTSISVTMLLPTITPYFPTNQIHGTMNGLRGSAEVEMLMNRPGFCFGQTLATSFAGMFFLIMVVLGNIIYLYERSGRREE